MNAFYLILLGFAVSIDGFATGIAYGLKKIHLPWTSLYIVGIITGLAVGAAMYGAYLTGSRLDTRLAMLCGSALLVALGVYTLFQECKNQIAAKLPSLPPSRQAHFPLSLLHILAEPATADLDNSKGISPWEALFLGLALGMDNMAVAFGACLLTPLPLYAPLVMAGVQVLVIVLGLQASKQLVSEKIKKKIPYLPGIILILLGLLRLN